MKSKTLRSSAVLTSLSILLAVSMVLAFLPQGASAAATGSISGKVTELDGTTPISGCNVTAFNTANEYNIGETKTLEDGTYTITSLNPGDYRVIFRSDDHVWQWYDGKYDPTDADPVTVTAGSDHLGINASLAVTGFIKGNVRKDNDQPVVGCKVKATSYDLGGVETREVITDSNGNYQINDLSYYAYKVQFLPPAGLVAEYFDNKSDAASADWVPVFSKTVDAILAPVENKIISCTPDSANQGKTLDVTIKGSGTNFVNGLSYATFSGYGIYVNSTTVKSKTTAVANITVLNGAATGPHDVNVVTGPENPKALKGGFRVKSSSPTAPGDTETWYLAEGTTAWGFNTYISVANPNDENVEIDVTYMTDQGAVPGGNYFLAPMSQGTLNPREILGDRDFSTTVTSTGGQPIAVDRTMSWNLPDGTVADGHCSIGVKSPRTTWYLAEGSSQWGFECWLLIQNPSDRQAVCDVTYMIEGKGPLTVQKTVPAYSRKSFDIADDIGAADASIKVESNVGVIPERAMYRNNRAEGHDSIGTNQPAADYYLAEGSSAWGFTTFVLVQNPQDTENRVNVVFMTTSGPVPHPDNPITLPPNSRHTIRVNDVLPGTDFSTQVSGTSPLIAERAMYWDSGTGEACHDSIGVSAAHTSFYLPDGQASEGRETFTLVQNPNDEAVTIEVSYLTPDGLGNVVFESEIKPDSRVTYNMSDSGINGRAGVMVRSLDPGLKIMAERAMYWSGRGAGTDTIGGESD
ncbi:MAG: carboxypeptidase regulatory-like domain-containing protein [Actinobacteria bacterium]|nr:carboxypeptidase regulatory-like domain-containing protein [Actinomycetota bacterium]